MSCLALGTMTFGEYWGWVTSEANARQLFGTYLEAGGNFSILLTSLILWALEGSLERLGTDYID